MSAFTIGEDRYSSGPMKEFGELGMGARLSRVLAPGMEFSYEYDFGSTTDLSIKVAGLREQNAPRVAIQLLARNDPPEIFCEQCGDHPAVMVCTECVWDGGGWLCNTCGEEHECGVEMCLPVVNSPRVGVCAYAG
ncbi:MAG TPA: hypothetical protein VN428_05760 [Bryobacteraceae bacterium]|nr:hypothetical protein [Bryobacteraceae bacterium]